MILGSRVQHPQRPAIAEVALAPIEQRPAASNSELQQQLVDRAMALLCGETSDPLVEAASDEASEDALAEVGDLLALAHSN